MRLGQRKCLTHTVGLLPHYISRGKLGWYTNEYTNAGAYREVRLSTFGVKYSYLQGFLNADERS